MGVTSTTAIKINSKSFGRIQKVELIPDLPSRHKLTMSKRYFPFTINHVSEEDIGTLFFTSMAHFDTATLLRCRLVSRGWRDAIDSHTELWNRMSLMRAIQDNRIDLCKLIVEYAGGKTEDMGDVDKQF